ncbi:MAG: serine protease [Chloroflexi bacterium]|nr:serine protease [Chloroflexota bacterium]
MIIDVDSTDGSALILTNYHVIVEAQFITVTVNDILIYSGHVRGVDAVRDLAVLEICCKSDFQYLEFGNANGLRLGTPVIAIGYPLDIEGEATVTTGDFISTSYEADGDRWLILSDAIVNLGNSGGPLLSMEGQIVGIVTLKSSPSVAGRDVGGLGQAISEVTILNLLPDRTSVALA